MERLPYSQDDFRATHSAFEPYSKQQNKAVDPSIDLSQDISKKTNFTRADLESCAKSRLFGEGNAQLPSPPLLMLDRVVQLQQSGGMFNRGFAIAEIDIDPTDWYFTHHFEDDPLMPGCFLTEAMWQLSGFYLAWRGLKGKGRVLESGNTRFIEPVKPIRSTLTVTVQIKKILTSNGSICFADADIRRSESLVCKSKSIKVGLFEQ